MDDHMILDKENTVESLEKQNQQQQQSIAHLHDDQSGESDKVRQEHESKQEQIGKIHRQIQAQRQ